MHDAARKQSSILTLTEDKIPVTVKISIYFKTQQSQYRSKYRIIFTQRFIEGKNFESCAYLNVRYLIYCYFCCVPWEFEIVNVHCISTLSCLIVIRGEEGEGSNKMHQGENHLDFLNRGLFLGHSLIMIKLT